MTQPDEQRGQKVHGPQTNVGRDMHGPMLSGLFQGPVILCYRSQLEEVVEKKQPSPIYFGLRVWEIGEKVDPFKDSSVQKPGPPMLKPGRTYRVQVRTLLSPNLQPGQTQTPLDTKVISDLRLWVMGETVGLAIHDPECTVSEAAIEDLSFEHEFMLTVKDECPTGKVELALAYRNKHNNRREVATRLQIQLEGTYAPVDRELLETTKIADTPLPEGTAIIYIHDGSEDLRLTGFNFRKRLDLDPFPRPQVSLTQFVEGCVEPSELRGQVRKFSRRNPPEFARWIDRLLKRHEEQLHIILCDHTASDFPWEMMEVYIEQEGEVPLGALAVMVRWIPVQCYKWRYLQVQEESCSGDMVAYLDQATGDDADVERLSVEPFAATKCVEMNEFMHQISHPHRPMGLLYLDCQGIFEYEHEIEAAVLHNPTQRPIVFVNAFHSGRLIREPNQRPEGLPEVFLARLARGYIGTLGPASPAYAAQIAHAIFQASFAEDGIRIGEVLKTLRRRVVRQLREKASPENWLRYIYTFMYIYYGNPFTRLQLVPADESEGQGEGQ